MTTPSQEAVEAAKLAYGEARMRFQTGADDPLGPIIALLARPAPSQSDEAKAREFALELHDEFIDNDIRNLAKQFAAVRAEATLAGAAAEREACAKLIEENSILFCSEGPNQLRPRMDGDRTGLDYATAIRARA